MTRRSPLYLALAVRLLSLLSQTYFQPDEFFQAYEPAHWLVFGSGYLSWEWREGAGEGRIRSWIWPSVFAVIYQLLAWLGLDRTVLLTLAPRLVCIVMAAYTDYFTYLLASKVLGHGAAPAAMFLSLTSLFNAHALPRAAGTSIETMLTVAALYYWPFSTSHHPHPAKKSKPADVWTQIPPQAESVNMVEVDVDIPGVYQPVHHNRLTLSLALSAVAFCIRPTNIFLWSFLGAELCLRQAWGKPLSKGVMSIAKLVGRATCVGSVVLAGSTALDYAITGVVALPPLTFLHQNLYRNISSFYGATSPLYHLTQTLPILLTTALPFFFPSFARSLAPASPSPAALRTMAWATIWTFGAWSCLPHAEWRFLHPVLPILIIFCAHTLVTTFTTVPAGALASPITAARCYTRINRHSFWWLLLAPILPAIYLGTLHGRAQVSVMDWLRFHQNVTDVVQLMPCHSTPWMSHLHEAGKGSWFLTCEPPLGIDPKHHITQQDAFYSEPARYLESSFLAPPSSSVDQPIPELPSHIVMFGCLLDEPGVADALTNRGYAKVWYGWNGFDMLQDEDKRRGGVAVWAQ